MQAKWFWGFSCMHYVNPWKEKERERLSELVRIFFILIIYLIPSRLTKQLKCDKWFNAKIYSRTINRSGFKNSRKSKKYYKVFGNG